MDFVADVPIYVCNNEKYGYIMVPSEDGQTMEDEFNQMLHVKQDASGNARSKVNQGRIS